MALTKEQIEDLRENPIAQFLFSLLNEVETYQPIKEERKCKESKMSVADYNYIATAAKSFNKCLINARQFRQSKVQR